MSRYDAVVKMWQDWNIQSIDDLALRLDNFRILFAYNSGKIENAEINYHDTREIFENGKVVGYTGSTRTLFEQQNQKASMVVLGSISLYRYILAHAAKRCCFRTLRGRGGTSQHKKT